MVHSDTGKYMFEKFKSENPKVKRERSIMPCSFAGPKIIWVDPRCVGPKIYYILCQSQTFCARQRDDLHSVKLVFLLAQNFLNLP